MAGAAIGGAVIGAVSDGLNTLASAMMAAKARKWAKKMYKHRYQYTMEDMRKAGLNPMLAMRTGVSGGVPSAAFSAASNTGAAQRGFAEGGKLGVQKTLARAQRENILEQTGTAHALTQLHEQNTGTSRAQAEKARMETFIMGTKVPRARIMEAIDKQILSPAMEGLGIPVEGSPTSARDSIKTRAGKWMGIIPSKKGE